MQTRAPLVIISHPMGVEHRGPALGNGMGVTVFQRRIRVFNKQKSTMGRLSRVTFLVMSITGEV